MPIVRLKGFWDARGVGAGPIELSFIVARGEAIISAGRIPYGSGDLNLTSFQEEIFNHEFCSGKISKDLIISNNKTRKFGVDGWALHTDGGTLEIFMEAKRGGATLPFKELRKTINKNATGSYEPVKIGDWHEPTGGSNNQTTFRIKT